jgi:hypothetical protein
MNGQQVIFEVFMTEESFDAAKASMGTIPWVNSWYWRIIVSFKEIFHSTMGRLASYCRSFRVGLANLDWYRVAHLWQKNCIFQRVTRSNVSLETNNSNKQFFATGSAFQTKLCLGFENTKHTR